MTAFERLVRDELERLAKVKTAGAKEALANFDHERVMTFFRDGVSVATAVVRLLVP